MAEWSAAVSIRSYKRFMEYSSNLLLKLPRQKQKGGAETPPVNKEETARVGLGFRYIATQHKSSLFIAVQHILALSRVTGP